MVILALLLADTPNRMRNKNAKNEIAEFRDANQRIPEMDSSSSFELILTHSFAKPSYVLSTGSEGMVWSAVIRMARGSSITDPFPSRPKIAF